MARSLHPDEALEPVFYDCEASCIGGLPIEIGWAFVTLATGVITSASYLIKPPATWDMQQVWDPDAQRLHGLSVDQLMADGRPPAVIARHMNEILAGRDLFADSPPDDERWLRIVFAEAGSTPTFSVRPTHADLVAATFATDRGWDRDRYANAKAVAARIAPRTHRAEADARYWAVVWRLIGRGQ
jgi:hypothetical protein